MRSSTSAQPTLWRTCRVLANRTRLRIIELLMRQPGRTVSAVAAELNLSLPTASQYLRALEARGLLQVRRKSRRVTYRLQSATENGSAQRLVVALSLALKRGDRPVETLFKHATAFTHPRRVEIFRALQRGPQTLQQLRTVTKIPEWALQRHLRKLEARAFVSSPSGTFVVVNQPDPFGRELARSAAE